jgi:hypothetical protein
MATSVSIAHSRDRSWAVARDVEPAPIVGRINGHASPAAWAGCACDLLFPPIRNLKDPEISVGIWP